MTPNLADVLAEQIRRFRTARQLSVARLAAMIAEFDPGTSLTQSALVNIERKPVKGGARRRVSVDELLMLSRALHVPPLVLVTPVGTEETFELLPGVDIAPFDAWCWIVGESPLADADADEVRDYRAAQQPIGLAREHDYYAHFIESELAEQLDDVDSDGVDYQEMVQQLMSLESVRRTMEGLGMILPELSGGVIQALEESGEFITYPGYRPSTMRRHPRG